MTGSLISFEQAEGTVLSTVQVGPIHSVPLRAALGHVLAEPIACDVDQPPFDRAMMDGYALRAADVATAPCTLIVVGEAAAGGGYDQSLRPGESIQINTGAPVPKGCDCVVPVEQTQRTGSEVLVQSVPKQGQHIGLRAAYAKAGMIVLEEGCQLGPGQIAVAASAGVSSVPVYRRPTVAILATGSELVEPSCKPTGSQIRDSNRYVLDALVRQAGCRPVDLGTVRDDRDQLCERIRQGLGCDFLCISGGVSMGQYDYVPGVLKACGVDIKFHKVAIKPGKPVLFGAAKEAGYAFGLPGNPVSVFVTFWILVRPALMAFQGAAAKRPRFVSAQLTGAVKATGDRQTYQPAYVRADDEGRLEVEPLVWHGSGNPLALAQANALIVANSNAPAGEVGDSVFVVLLDLP